MRVFKILFISIFFFNSSVAQKIPSVNIKTLEGKTVNTASFENNGDPVIISFWALWCKSCIKELEAISEVYEDWQDETNVKIIAISIDDSRSMSKVNPYVNASDWDYEVYLDTNSDLKRAMGVSTVPHTFLLNAKKEIVWQHKGYIDGDENELYKEIKKLVK